MTPNFRITPYMSTQTVTPLMAVQPQYTATPIIIHCGEKRMSIAPRLTTIYFQPGFYPCSIVAPIVDAGWFDDNWYISFLKCVPRRQDGV